MLSKAACESVCAAASFEIANEPIKAAKMSIHKANDEALNQDLHSVGEGPTRRHDYTWSPTPKVESIRDDFATLGFIPFYGLCPHRNPALAGNHDVYRSHGQIIV